jgi:hypothetical protein
MDGGRRNGPSSLAFVGYGRLVNSSGSRMRFLTASVQGTPHNYGIVAFQERGNASPGPKVALRKIVSSIEELPSPLRPAITLLPIALRSARTMRADYRICDPHLHLRATEHLCFLRLGNRGYTVEHWRWDSLVLPPEIAPKSGGAVGSGSDQPSARGSTDLRTNYGADRLHAVGPDA